MATFEARVRPEFRLRYPELNLQAWYEVTPLFPGLRERRVNMAGQRVARLRVRTGYLEVLAEHLDFRPMETAVT